MSNSLNSERTLVSEPTKSECIHILIVAPQLSKSNDESHKVNGGREDCGEALCSCASLQKLRQFAVLAAQSKRKGAIGRGADRWPSQKDDSQSVAKAFTKLCFVVEITEIALKEVVVQRKTAPGSGACVQLFLQFA